MAFAAVRNFCHVVAYLCMSIIIDMIVFFFIDVLFGADLFALNIETLAYALDAREWFPVFVIAVIREVVALVVSEKNVQNAGNGEERMCRNVVHIEYSVRVITEEEGLECKDGGDVGGEVVDEKVQNAGIGIGRMCRGSGRGSTAMMMMMEEEEEYVDCKDGGDVQVENKEEREDEQVFDLGCLFDDGGESMVEKDKCDWLQDERDLGLDVLFAAEKERVGEGLLQDEDDLGLNSLFGEISLSEEENVDEEDEGESEWMYPIQCYDLLQEIMLELDNRAAEAFEEEEIVDDDELVGDAEQVLEEEEVEVVVGDGEGEEQSEEEEDKDDDNEDDVRVEAVDEGDVRVEAKGGVDGGSVSDRMVMYESESDEMETEDDVNSQEEYLGDGEESDDSGIDRRSVELAKCEEKYERRPMADLILFFENFSK